MADFRRNRITRPIFRWARGVLPRLSETERDALEAGEVWWDADLFAGNPDWAKLHAVAKPMLSAEEQAFMDGPVTELCGMIDQWQIDWELRDLPPEMWRFLREKQFFGMIIPKEYGGLGFSAFAHSEVVRRVSTRSVSAAVTVMVPNSLGPGELLMQFGTDAQKDYWLPRLADGSEIPAFGLTSEEAGSDAAAMVDTGVVCKGEWDGEEVMGLRLNWSKRYITLGPVATVLGLAFKLRDPDGLLGGEVERGITVALVPTDLPGVEIGRRHIPAMQSFQNGPNQGHDVFLPIDHVIGGRDGIGRGWPMLMSALAAGRGISLPSLASAAAAFAARTTGAYSRVREQFGIPVGKFEGVRVRLARLAGYAYQLDAARRLTCAGLDEGRHLAVISAIMKSTATYRMRTAVDDAMDVHAGKAVIDGPRNYLGNLHRAVPVGITVEGANILTRNMIVFGQGAIRCHPYLLDEMLALENPDKEEGLKAFDRAFWAHVGHAFRNLGRAWGRSWTGGLFAPAPGDAGPTARHYRALSRYAAAFNMVADLLFLTMGGALKRRESISARMGDILGELYMQSAVLKRWQDDGRPDDDLPLVDWSLSQGLELIDRQLSGVLHNMPNRFVAALARFVVQPLGARRRGPSDVLIDRAAETVFAPSETRDRLVGDIFCGTGNDAISLLETAWDGATGTESLRRRMKDAGHDSYAEAEKANVLSADEVERLDAADDAVAAVIKVDDFAPEEITGHAHEPDKGRNTKKRATEAPRRKSDNARYGKVVEKMKGAAE
ncbi:MAG: acyl-CoA dehydrogenase [Paracoccaceae bacterium]